MKDNWHSTYDVVVVGSGGGALTGAVTAESNGMKTLVIEKLDRWGGSTSYSGGGLWIPNNFLMKEQGCLDSPEEGLQYMEACIEDVGPASSRARKEAYVKYGPEMVVFLRDLGFQWVRGDKYPDYYPNLPGGKTGRVVEGEFFDGKKLGKFRKSLLLAPGMTESMPYYSGNFYKILLVKRSMIGLAAAMEVAMITLAWKVKGKVCLSMGRSLVGQLMYILQSKYKSDVWLSSPLTDIIMEDGRAVGVVVEKEGNLVNVQAKKGILLAAGGFPKNEKYRRKYQSVGADWSSAAPGNTGDVHQIAEKHKIPLALMDEAWWGGSFFLDGKIEFAIWERSFPGSMLVDQHGNRFVNESTSYIDFGRKLIDHNAEVGGAIPSWLILDANHRKRYVFQKMSPGMTPKKYIKDGTFIKANTIEELATKCGINRENLLITVKRFNSFAYQGLDDDFGRGNDIYDRYYADYRVLPNANLAPIENAPFYAVKIYPGDLGTKGGLLTNENAQVLNEDGSVIEGLYCTGNNSASVMGRTYPGPGSTLGPSCTFAYIGMNHLAKK